MADNNMEFMEGNNVEEVPPEPEEGGSNRTFLIVAGVLGGIMVLAIACLALYALVLAPQRRNQQATQVAQINAQNTQVHLAAEQTALAAKWTPTPTATAASPFVYVVKEGDTVDSIARQFGVDVAVLRALNNMTEALVRVGEEIMIPNPGLTLETLSPSPTPVLAQPTAASPTIDRTGTVAALLTEAAAGKLTITPTASGLPDTGFADNVGVPGLFGLALVLLAVIFLARRLRTAG
jgi:LPXTG-motif cell wall-anchored protein